MPKRKRDEETTRLWCVCRRPNDPKLMMLQCDCCEEWYHPECIKINPEEIDFTVEWVCEACTDVLRHNPLLKHTDISRMQGRVVPKTGWTKIVHLNEFQSKILEDNVMSKKNQNDGYRLWHANRILVCASNMLQNTLYYRFEVQASMKMQIYCVTLCFTVDGKKLKWKNCGCPAGIEGECKHVVASLYALQDYILRQEDSFPEAESQTERRQMWHIKKPVAAKDAILFSSRTIEKSRPGKDKNPLSANVYTYNKTLDASHCVTKESIMKLTSNLRHLNIPVLKTFESNSYEPVQRKEAHNSTEPVADSIFSQMTQAQFTFNFDERFSKMLQLHQEFCRSLITATWEDVHRIEESTRLQGQSPYWKKFRYYRLTSSNFKKFCRLRNTTCPVNTYKQINRSRCTSIAEQHGKLYECIAIKKLLDVQDLFPNVSRHSSVGLVVHPSLPFLGTSPDYAVVQDGRVILIEVKCPYSLYIQKKSIQTAAMDTGFHLTKRSDGSLSVNQDSSTYYQIQGQLNITNTDYAVLVVFVPPSDLEHVIVDRDSNFFSSCVEQLGTVWFEKLLPSFADDS